MYHDASCSSSSSYYYLCLVMFSYPFTQGFYTFLVQVYVGCPIYDIFKVILCGVYNYCLYFDPNQGRPQRGEEGMHLA